LLCKTTSNACLRRHSLVVLHNTLLRISKNNIF
jgi:hypothetical protein